MARAKARYDYLLETAPTRDYYTREYEIEPEPVYNTRRHASEFFYNELRHQEKYQLAKDMDKIEDVDRTPIDSEFQLRRIDQQEWTKEWAPWRREPDPVFEEYDTYSVETIPVQTRTK